MWCATTPRVRAPGRGATAAALRSIVRVLIVDDVPPFRAAVRALLERRGYTVVGEADRAAKAAELVAVLRPDAVLLDAALPDQNGFDLAARLTLTYPSLAVLMTSSGFEDSYYALARKSGATGYIPKSLLPRIEFARFWPGAHRRLFHRDG